MAPWRGPRHKSWASNTNLGAVSCLVIFGIYMAWALFDPNHIPSGLTPLLGIAGGVWFGAITDDKRRKDREVESTGNRALATADRAETKADDALTRSDYSLRRETEWSQHRDHRPNEAGQDE